MDAIDPGGIPQQTYEGPEMFDPGGDPPPVHTRADALNKIVNPQQAPARKRIFRSFFVKKLERKFEEKELEVPQQLLSLMDVPFEDFTPEDKELYETKIKPLAFVFVEHLMEVYEVMGRPRRGWEEMLERVDPSPIKVLASLVIHEDEKTQLLEEEPDPAEVAPMVSAPAEKISVRVYAKDREQNKERWWEKKLF
ncbi:MAG: hypothetical protein AB1384_15705 [Actinomycetota bacterium]